MSTFDRTEFGRRLKSQRFRIGVTKQKELAKRSGVSGQSMNYYERGIRLPDAEVLSALAVQLKCTSDYLLQLEDATAHDRASIVEETGLSEKAVETLCDMKRRSTESVQSSDGIELFALSTLLSNPKAHDFLRALYFYLFENPSMVTLVIKGKLTNYSLDDVMMVTITDQNESTRSGIFKEDFSTNLQAARINKMQTVLAELRTEVKASSNGDGEDNIKLVNLQENLANMRKNILEQLK